MATAFRNKVFFYENQKVNQTDTSKICNISLCKGLQPNSAFESNSYKRVKNVITLELVVINGVT